MSEQFEFVKTIRDCNYNDDVKQLGKGKLIYDYAIIRGGELIGYWVSNVGSIGYKLCDRTMIIVSKKPGRPVKPIYVNKKSEFQAETELYISMIPTQEQIAKRQADEQEKKRQRDAQQAERERIERIREHGVELFAALKEVTNQLRTIQLCRRETWSNERINMVSAALLMSDKTIAKAEGAV